MDVSQLLDQQIKNIKNIKKQIEKFERNRQKQAFPARPSPVKINAKSVALKANRRGRRDKRNANATENNSANSTIESIDSDDSDDCELIEQESDLIILDEDSNSSTSVFGDNKSGDESDGQDQAIEESVSSGIHGDSNGIELSFYEDRVPGTSYNVPLYDSVPCAVVSANDAMSFANRNHNSERNDRLGVSVKNRLGFRGPKSSAQNGLTLTNNAVPRSLSPPKPPNSFDTPNVSKTNITVAVDSSMATRTCEITSSSSEIHKELAPLEIDEVRTVVVKASEAVGTTTAAQCEPQPQESPRQVTIVRALPKLLTDAAVDDVEPNDTTTEPVRRGVKRRRIDSDVILVDVTPGPWKADDSVIFVSESQNTKRPLVEPAAKRKGGPMITFGDPYIPFSKAQKKSPATKNTHKRSTRAQRKVDKKMEKRLELLAKRGNQKSSCPPTVTEKVKTPEANNNTNNDKKAEEVKDPNQLEKRVIIIDGSNVAFRHGGPQNFSVRGIELCLEYFQKCGFEAKAVVPQMRVKANKSTDPKRLNQLVDEGKVLLTPCKKLPGQRSTSYDDRIILDIAAGLDAVIISNDNYADLINQKPEWDVLIKSRVVGFTFCFDLLVFPNDPYGKEGQTLNEILHKPKST